MPILTVLTGTKVFNLEFSAGQNILNILEKSEIHIRLGCNGIGACGLCTIKVCQGVLSKPTMNEVMLISEEDISLGVRLACQVTSEEDVTIDVSENLPQTRWRKTGITYSSLENCAPQFHSLPHDNPLGMAVDIGTTHIRVMVCDLATGREILSVVGSNPQNIYGADVISRLVRTSDSDRFLDNISRKAIFAIGEALTEIASLTGINLQHIKKTTIVGNTAMLALLSRKNTALLLNPIQWSSYIDCLPDDTGDWAIAWGIHPHAMIEIIPPLGGFIGSDLLAGIEAVSLTKGKECKLFIDFGTNTEIALWDGATVWVTSCAGGPAFEGSGISCGMPFDLGAIYGITSSEGKLEYRIVGNVAPRGICGSGIVDLIASLIRLKVVDCMGNFTGAKPQFAINIKNTKVIITKKDIDIVQRAKASVGAAIISLLAKAGHHSSELAGIYLTGHFGSVLNISNAQDIGIIPMVDPEIVSLFGNTAILGARNCLLSKSSKETIKTIGQDAKVVNLAKSSSFEELLFENLFLTPMGVV